MCSYVRFLNTTPFAHNKIQMFQFDILAQVMCIHHDLSLHPFLLRILLHDAVESSHVGDGSVPRVALARGWTIDEIAIKTSDRRSQDE